MKTVVLSRRVKVAKAFDSPTRLGSRKKFQML